jgi:hypothetical protein
MSQSIAEILALQGVLANTSVSAAAATRKLSDTRATLSSLTQSDNPDDPSVRFIATLAQKILLLSEDSQKWLSTPLHIERRRIPGDVDIEVPNKLFAHIHGDFYAYESGLEGVKWSEYLMPSTYLKEVLPILIAHGDTGVPTASLERIQEAMRTFPTVPMEQMMESSAALRSHIRGALESVGTAAFPGGWSSFSGSHAIWYEVSRQDDGSHTFRVYNRGAGATYHDAPSLREGKLYYPAYY